MTARLITAVIAAKKLHPTLQHWICILWHSIPKDARCSVSPTRPPANICTSPEPLKSQCEQVGSPSAASTKRSGGHPKANAPPHFCILLILHLEVALGDAGVLLPAVPHSSAAGGAPNTALHPTVLCPFGCSCSVSPCLPPRTSPHHTETKIHQQLLPTWCWAKIGKQQQETENKRPKRDR